MIGVMIVLLVALPVMLLVAAVIIRAGVSFANKSLPKATPRYDDDDDDGEYDDWADYDRPKHTRSSGPIPEPSIGKAMGIAFIQSIIQFALSLFARVAGDEMELRLLIGLIMLPVMFLIAAGIRCGMLPTTFPRACLVVLFE